MSFITGRQDFTGRETARVFLYVKIPERVAASEFFLIKSYFFRGKLAATDRGESL